MFVRSVNPTTAFWSSSDRKTADFLHLRCGRLRGRSGVAVVLDELKAYRMDFKQEDVKTGRFGKPEIPAAKGLNFNIAHDDDDYALALTSVGAVGIDIQAPFRLASRLQAMEAVFTPAELLMIRALPQAPHFWWSIKEALVKCAGSSIWFGRCFDLTDDSSEAAVNQWFFSHGCWLWCRFRNDKAVSLAIKADTPPPDPVFIDENFVI